MSEAIKVKYMDDATVATTINLRTGLILDQNERSRPLQFSERIGHMLPSKNLLQLYLNDMIYESQLP